MQGILAIKHIMDPSAAVLHRDPLSVWMAYYSIKDNQLPPLMPMFLNGIDFIQR